MDVPSAADACIGCSACVRVNARGTLRVVRNARRGLFSFAKSEKRIHLTEVKEALSIRR